MAEFSIEIDNPYKESYDGIISTYNWIVKSLTNIGVEIEKINCNFTFRTGKIRCIVDSLDEFKEYAYGVDNYSFTSGSIAVHDKNNILFDSILISLYSNELFVKACDRVLLATIDEALKQSIESNDSNNNVIKQYNISGNNIAVASENSTATVISESPKSNVNNSQNRNEIKKESKIKSFLTGIINNIVSNIIWYILGFLFTGSVLAIILTKIFN